jgi:hypothetical protein
MHLLTDSNFHIQMELLGVVFVRAAYFPGGSHPAGSNQYPSLLVPVFNLEVTERRKEDQAERKLGRN